ncbi:MAG: response regulator [Proteobacteria bacterium]|nr:response regulator [Pseudomonadota bacterium]MBU4129400.1 response regulator [Pseudomonadota bacterium]
MNIWNKIFRYWQAMSISSKFGLGGSLFLGLIVMVAATGYWSLQSVRKAESAILISSEIQRLVLDMDRGMEKSRRLYNAFFLHYPMIGFEAAHRQYVQPSIRQIAKVIGTSQLLKRQIKLSSVGGALQKSHIDLNLYLSSARRFAQTSIESIELETELSAPKRGLYAQLMRHLQALETELSGQGHFLNLYHEMKSYIQEYRIIHRRFLMQSAFNVSFTLYRQIETAPILGVQDREKITGLLDQIIDISEKILETDGQITSIFNDISLQEKTEAPISGSLVQLAAEEMQQARRKIAYTHKVTVILIAGIALFGVLAALGIWKLLNDNITKKIIRLTKTAKEFRKGNLGVCFEEEGKDEIGQLAVTFNIMAARIQAFVDGLESKVEIRTNELKSANNKLLREVEDRIKAQANLEETQAILQAALDNSQAGILIAEARTGKVQYINEVGLFLMGESKQTIGDSFNIFTYVRKFQGYDLDGNLLEPGGYPVTRAIREGKPVSMEYWVKQSGREDRFMWANAAPIINTKGEVLAGISIFLDITKRKMAEKEKETLESQLRQVYKMEAIGILAGGIAHDFNNLLAVIIGYADLAKQDIPGEHPAKLQIEEILKAGNRARDLVKQILAFSRKSQVGRFPVQIHSIVTEALHLLRASIPATIEIRQEIDTECGSVLADQTQIHQVVLNLCTNAAQVMEKEGGILDVSLTRVEIDPARMIGFPGLGPGPHVKLTVKDTGKGIDKQILNKIFDPYFTTKEIGKGSGMGLAMVHGIVKSHKGLIQVDTISGMGSVFHVYLPVIEEEILIQDKIITPLLTGTEHILVVDDEAPIAEMTKRRLERLGYQVTSLTSSMDALALFRKYPGRFDLVLTDQTMPHLTGEKMAQEMIRIQKDIPIILSTGYSSSIDQEKIERLGIRAFLMKPTEIRELSDCVRQVLAGQKQSKID